MRSLVQSVSLPAIKYVPADQPRNALHQQMMPSSFDTRGGSEVDDAQAAAEIVILDQGGNRMRRERKSITKLTSRLNQPLLPQLAQKQTDRVRMKRMMQDW